MKKLLLSLLVIASGVLALDRATGLVFRHIYDRSRDVVSQKIRYIATDACEDVVLFGTSRCGSHYVPQIIADSLQLSCYNAGVDGSKNIYAHYSALGLLLSHHTPRVVCLELMPSDYLTDDDDFATLGYFAPFVGQSNMADSVFRLSGRYAAYRLSAAYRYNANAISLVGSMVARGHELDNGYLAKPLPPPVPVERLDCVDPSVELDSVKLGYIQAFVDRCVERGIKVAFTISPWCGAPYNDMYKPVYDIARRNGLTVFDYHSQMLFADQPELFYDDVHLWDKGSRLFTRLFAGDLKDWLNGSGE